MRYPLVFYVKSLPPDVGGMANGPFIRILNKYRDDEGIHQHEIEHVVQWSIFFAVGLLVACFSFAVMNDALFSAMIATIGFSAHSVLYKFVEPYRLMCEVEAYRVQANYYSDDRRKLFGEFIAKYYNLNITADEAEKLLRG